MVTATRTPMAKKMVFYGVMLFYRGVNLELRFEIKTSSEMLEGLRLLPIGSVPPQRKQSSILRGQEGILSLFVQSFLSFFFSWTYCLEFFQSDSKLPRHFAPFEIVTLNLK